ncbi:MAG TPA: papain-like cysteine protease family protein [Longimicrobium sp.]
MPPAPGPGDDVVVAAVTVPYFPQLMDNWCWAATIEMVVAAIAGQNPRQCVLANQEFQREDCCPTKPACDQGAPLTSFAGILMNWGIDSRRINRPLLFNDVLQQVNAGRPIIYNLTFTVQNDEVYHTGIIANAYQASNGDQYVFFLDSDEKFFQAAGRDPYGWVKYADILNAYGYPGNWTDTIYDIH